MNENVNDQDVLLVTDKKGKGLEVVSENGKDGKIKSVSPKAKNEPQFLKLDKQGNVLDNFFSNFRNQYKDPTHFQFFKVPVKLVESMSALLNEMLKQPENLMNKETLDKHRVSSDEVSAKQTHQPIDESRIDWKQLEKLGVSRENLESTGSLDAMLNWGKSPVLIPITPKFDEMTLRTDARLSFREVEGKLTVAIHAVRRSPELDRPFFGIHFSDDDKKNLLSNGNAGRILAIEFPGQQPTPAYVSIDKLTNELVFVRADKIRIPNEIKGVSLDDKQLQSLKEGKAIYLKDMLSKSGKPFNATVQINADKRGIEFSFDNNQTQSQKQSNSEFAIPTKLGGIDLPEADQSRLKEGGTIHVTGMKDREGQEYSAYVKVNTEEGKLNFYRWDPDKSNAKEISPDETSKTQVAVNTDGKTNEATKKIEASLKKGQEKPTESQEKKADESNIAKPKLRIK